VALRLGTSLGPSYRQIYPKPPVLASGSDARPLWLVIDHAWTKRIRPEYVFDTAVASDTAKWVSALLSDWIKMERPIVPRLENEALLERASFGSPSSSIGFRLSMLSARFIDAVFSRRRALNKASEDFCYRRRDAACMQPQSVGRTERPTVAVVICSTIPLDSGEQPPADGPRRVRFSSATFYMSDTPTLNTLPFVLPIDRNAARTRV